MNLLLTPSAENRDLRLRLYLLLGQSFSLGILLALLVITANALFLSDFGAASLPYVYLLVAVLGSLVSYGSARAQSVWTLPQIAMATITAVILTFFAAWLARTATQARWVSFALITAFPLLLQIGFVILGGQAGRLLDVRQIKRLFPQIVTGFVVGFIIGGLLMPFLITLLSTIENVILVMEFALLIILLLIFELGRRYPGAFQVDSSQAQGQPTKTLPQLLRKPFVRWIFLYQILLAALVQLTDFLVLAQTEIRYDSGEAIAQFFSSFSVIMNVTDLLFLLLIAAFFLRRFGLKAGLLANPLFLTFNLAIMLVVGFILNIDSLLFFGLVIVARIMTITLADGTTRTSINAVYQALPFRERTLVQTGAEGIGAPLALGGVGLVLLLLNVVPGLTLIHVSIFTFLLAVFWVFISLMVYRNYAAALLQAVKRRSLQDVDLTLADEAGLLAVNQLVQSSQLNEVRLGLDMLQAAVHPSYDDKMVALLRHTQPEIQIEALGRIEQKRLTAVLPQLHALLAENKNDAVLGATLQALCALAEAEAVAQVAPYLDQEADAVKQGALVGLLRYGGISGVMAAAPYLGDAQQAALVPERVLVARVIGAVQRQDFYEPLLTLLQDNELPVRLAALEASAQVRHPRLLPQIIGCLQQAATRSGALAALYNYGPTLLPHVAAALEGRGDYPLDVCQRLVRVCGQIGGADAINLLRQHLQHPRPELQEQVVVALNLCGYQAELDEHAAIYQSLQHQVSQAAIILAAQRDIGTEEAVSTMQQALQDEYNRVRRRLFYLLSLLYDSQAILRAEELLSRESEGIQALALEMLEVTLSAEAKTIVMPLVELQLTPARRLQQLPSAMHTPQQDLEAWLTEIMINRSGQWREPWLQACAIYTAAQLALTLAPEIQSAVTTAAGSENLVVRETAVWALQTGSFGSG